MTPRSIAALALLGSSLATAEPFVAADDAVVETLRADPRYDGYAQAVLAPWWELASPPTAVLLLRATLAQRRHAFEAALADLDRLLARRPGRFWPATWAKAFATS